MLYVKKKRKYKYGRYKGHTIFIQLGYPSIVINGRNEYIHRLEYERYHEVKIQKGEEIHHWDNNRMNWKQISNLYLCSSMSEHQKFHRRMKKKGKL